MAPGDDGEQRKPTQHHENRDHLADGVLGNYVPIADRGHRLHSPPHTQPARAWKVSGSTKCSTTPKTTTEMDQTATITYAA